MSFRFPDDRSPYRCLAAIAALNLFLSLPGLWVPFYNIDEVTNALYGRFINGSQLGLVDFIGSPYFLTHYLYAAVDRLFGLNELAAIHVVFALWRTLAAVAFYFAGRELAGERAGVMASFFYVTASFSFMSKDFHTPSAEGFAVLPAVLAFCAILRHLRRPHLGLLLAAGILEGVAALFKMPMGILWLGTFMFLSVTEKKPFKPLAVFSGAFFLVFLAPLLLFGSVSGAFKTFVGTLDAASFGYIQAYQQASFLYILVKFALRSLLIATGMFTVFFFFVYAARNARRDTRGAASAGAWFLLLACFLLWPMVLLGKRIFYHYYVFVLAPLPLLAGLGYVLARARVEKGGANGAVAFFVRYAVPLALLPAVGFGIEGAFNGSTRPPDVKAVTEYVREHTRPGDPIYIWGLVPQVYLFADRPPASTMFWSDLLAGASPGSPAMEYMRATGRQLTISENIVKDLMHNPFASNPDPVVKSLNAISENELFNSAELLERIDNPYWKQTFKDFFAKPPVLFIDTAPSNIRGFGHYPIANYELMNRFLKDNYVYETQRNRMLLYRLKSPQPAP